MTWNMARKLKKKKMRNIHSRIWIWQENRKTWKKKEKHILGPAIWQETLKNMENETQTLCDLENGKKY
jgi:hypothetical protein